MEPGLRTEALSVFGRVDEGLDHFGLSEVTVEVIELVQPEVVAGEVQSRLRRIVRIPSQVTEVLHQHEGAVEFLPLYRRIFCHTSQCPSSRSGIAGIECAAKFIDGGGAIGV